MTPFCLSALKVGKSCASFLPWCLGALCWGPTWSKGREGDRKSQSRIAHPSRASSLFNASFWGRSSTRQPHYFQCVSGASAESVMQELMNQNVDRRLSCCESNALYHIQTECRVFAKYQTDSESTMNTARCYVRRSQQHWGWQTSSIVCMSGVLISTAYDYASFEHNSTIRMR